MRQIRVITKLPNSEQSYKGKVKIHKATKLQCMVCIDVGHSKLFTLNMLNNKYKSVEYLMILL
jgi:hypothetical protein